MEEPHSPKKHIGASAFAGTFGAQLIILTCMVLQGVLIARMLGPVGRGEYAATILWPMLFGSTSVIGIYIAIGRIAAKTHDYAMLVRSSVVVTLITSTISSIACFIALPWLMPTEEDYLIPLARLCILAIPLTGLILNLNAIDQGRGDFKQFNFIRSIMNPVYVLLLLAIWLLGFGDVRWCIITLILGYSAPVMVLLVTAVRRYSFIGKLYSLKEIIVESIPFSLAGIFQVLYLHVDKALMLWLLGTKKLGFYTVALSVSGVVGSITVSAGMVSFTTAAQTGHGKGFDRLAKTFRVAVLLWIFLGGVLALLMPFVLPLVFGNEFAEAIAPARLLILGSAFVGLANMLEQAVRGQGKAYIGLEGRLAGLVILIFLAIPLSRFFNIIGVCWAFILGQFVCLSVIIWRTNIHYSNKDSMIYMPKWRDIEYLFKLFWNSVRLFLSNNTYP